MKGEDRATNYSLIKKKDQVKNIIVSNYKEMIYLKEELNHPFLSRGATFPMAILRNHCSCYFPLVKMS